MIGERRRTKIVATIGPASSSHEMVRALVQTGVDAVRLNFSHGTQEDHATRAGITRAVQAELSRPLALIADLQGPKLRIGDLPAPRVLETGELVVIAGEEAAQPGDLPVAPSVISQVLSPGNDVLIDDGLVRLTAIAGYVNPDNAGHRDKHRGRESCEELTTSTGHGVSLRQVVAA